MCETFAASEAPDNQNTPRPFVYISAEDIMRPLVPHGYIQSKREAEQGIASMLRSRADLRPVFIRPSELTMSPRCTATHGTKVLSIMRISGP
jgi:hypothetical protein